MEFDFEKYKKNIEKYRKNNDKDEDELCEILQKDQRFIKLIDNRFLEQSLKGIRTITISLTEFPDMFFGNGFVMEEAFSRFLKQKNLAMIEGSFWTCEKDSNRKGWATIAWSY